MRQSLDGHVANLDATAGMMESLEIDTADYRQLLFEVTGEITTGLLSGDVLAGLLSTWTGNTVDWITTNGPGIFFKTVLFLLILLVFRILSRISRKVVRKAIQTSSLKVSQLLERTALSVTGAAVMIFGILVALSQLGVEVGPLLAGLGVVGFIIGFALQDTLGNFAAGVMILLYRPYDVGDLIEVAGGSGRVNDMTLVATTILTLDHQTLVIPNNKIWGDVIKNVTAQKERRIDMIFGISYSDDIPHAEHVLEEILVSHEKVLEDPEPIVKLHNLGESSVDFVVRPWVKTDDYWDVYWDITREVKIRFDTEEISIPFPQRDVHVFEEQKADKS
jgi:small conductance mechanosensitive channel